VNRFTFAFATAFLFSSFSHAINPDGCFQMYMPSVMYPIVCVDGANEEGIGGARARVALVGPNSSQVKWCGLTTRIRLGNDPVNRNQTTYYFDDSTGKSEIRFDGAIEPSSNLETGTVTIGSTTLKYMRLSEKHTKLALGYIYKSGLCDK
jgi:hypothetical protein